MDQITPFWDRPHPKNIPYTVNSSTTRSPQHREINRDEANMDAHVSQKQKINRIKQDIYMIITRGYHQTFVKLSLTYGSYRHYRQFFPNSLMA